MTKILRVETIHDGWSKFLMLTVRLADGVELRREVEDHGSAVTVLPYDPERRVALLVRQLRVPVLHAGGPDTVLEAPAGRIESADPAECARREAVEEVGVALTTLDRVGTVWSMPGVATEQMTLYLAPFSARDRVGAGGGLSSEHENIEVVEMPLSELWSLYVEGQLEDLKTLALVQALRLREPQLFTA
jgi:nudix-type nucleoside diphosphatase (YffH/AdpP family)